MESLDVYGMEKQSLLLYDKNLLNFDFHWPSNCLIV